MKPILTRSEITDAVYIVTKYKVLEDGLVRTTEKYDVTNQFDAMTEPLRAENTKLRELVETMYVDMCEMLDIIDKSSDTRGYCRYYDERLDAAEGIMRELGIEVG